MSETIEPAEIFYGSHHPPQPDLIGPLPGRRSGNVIAYEMSAPASFETWPGRSRVERKYALLDLGVSFGLPCWSRHTRPDGTTWSAPPEAETTWYVDLVTIERVDDRRFVLKDLFIDIMISRGRVPRMLDLDEIADAADAGWITTAQLTDGLRRWQTFLDRHLHTHRFPQPELTDFPPACISALADLPGEFGPPVTWPD